VTIVPETQLQTNWCWATCARMVARATGPAPPEQCVIAGQFLHAAGCCTNGANEPCNKPLDARLIPQLYSAFKMVAVPLASAGQVTEPIVRQALQAGPLVQLLLDLSSTFHYALLTGVTNDSYAVVDPRYGAFPASWSDLSSGYGQGSLAAAWRLHAQT
jgi:hypothetical protein